MRNILPIVLLIMTATPVVAAERPLDKLAVDAIENIVDDTATDKNLSIEQEAQLHTKLFAAARRDRKIEKALVFAQCGHLLLKKSGSEGAAWNTIQTMGRNYTGDGVLPVVNYKNLATPENSRKFNAFVDGTSDNEERLLMLTRVYEEARQNGLSPQQAFAKSCKDADCASGLKALRQQFLGMGTIALMGYDASSAQRDVEKFLESRYAVQNPDARDIGAVRREFSPVSFLLGRVEEGVALDIRRVMKPVDSIVSKAVGSARPAAPLAGGVDGPPSYDGLNRTQGVDAVKATGIPGWDQMKEPAPFKMDTLKDRTHVQQECWLAPNDDGDADTRLKGDIPWRDDKVYFRLNGMTFDAPVFKIRQAIPDTRLRKIGAFTQKGQPNQRRVAEFNVWYWAEKGSTLYFADGSAGSPEPPAAGRVYLPASRGVSVPVRIPYRTNAAGKGHIMLFARGRCSIELSHLYWSYPD